MDLNRLSLFLKVAEAGSLSKASAKAFLSQPALSLQIQALEEELKLKLFERHNRGLILTEEGRLLFERAKLLMDWEEETLSILEDQKKPAGLVRIGTYTTISSYLLPSRLHSFLHAYPDIELNYDYSSMDAAIEKVKRRELDMLIMSEVPDQDSLIKIPLSRDKLVLVASGKNKVIPAKLTPSELGEVRFLTYPHKFDYCYREIEKKLGRYLEKAARPITSESFDTLKQSLIHDLGIGFMPRYLIERELADKTLREIELKGIQLPIQFWMVLRPDFIRSHKLRVLKEHLQKAF